MRKRSRLLRFGLFLLSTLTINMASANIALGQGEHTMKIRFVFDDRTVTATLNDSPSTQDFLRQLPLSFELEDYARTEKIADLPRKLTTQGAPSGTASKAGDIAYYAPWGNLVIFYKDFGYASGLIHLGQLDGGLDRLTSNGSMRVTIERAD
ncbi:cyclophilin-like fold protein [Vibrio furnissii]|uniref:cyclophilin-like fold protein n=1 Tax=Vibrio furnissii TaxID=29494 RepID=UPI001F5579D0|nr:cyclophilin-like fold protein [Vibrio furnissii]